jgi:hypothetical protein
MAPTCKICGGEVMYGNLYCSAKCGHIATGEFLTAEVALTTAGFVQDAEALNTYRKDGVAVTLEHIDHVGLEEAIQHHATVAAIRAHALGVSTADAIKDAGEAEPATDGEAAAITGTV